MPLAHPHFANRHKALCNFQAAELLSSSLSKFKIYLFLPITAVLCFEMLIFLIPYLTLEFLCFQLVLFSSYIAYTFSLMSN